MFSDVCFLCFLFVLCNCSKGSMATLCALIASKVSLIAVSAWVVYGASLDSHTSSFGLLRYVPSGR